jgi:Mor family transcriptional regulator
MSNKSIRNHQRDKDIFWLRQKGLTTRELSKKYKLSQERIRQLYLREKERRGVNSDKI